MNQNIIEKFNDLLGEEKVKVDEPMKRHTTFRIGGPADYFLLPSSEEELSGILKICKNEELPYFILGNGSNLLVRTHFSRVTRMGVENSRIERGRDVGNIIKT